MKILSHWILLCDRFDSLVVRERILLFGSLVAGIYLVFDTLFIMPATKEVKRLKEEISVIEKKTDQYIAEKNVFDRVSKNDPDADIKRELLKLKGRFLQLESNLAELSLRLVPIERIPVVLTNVSQKTDSVRLKTIQTLKPEVIDFSAPKRIQLKSLANAVNTSMEVEDDKHLTPQGKKVYKYGIRIVLEGTYFEVLDFLAALESFEWQFYWEGLDYKVINYPRASVELEIYTLSISEGL
ncbi:MAG: hypothetical protein U5M23_14145 [Marinagarivorans sp.]|nr:hypothetical protein [Marinagarivorans sp.]